MSVPPTRIVATTGSARLLDRRTGHRGGQADVVDYIVVREEGFWSLGLSKAWCQDGSTDDQLQGSALRTGKRGGQRLRKADRRVSRPHRQDLGVGRRAKISGRRGAMAGIQSSDSDVAQRYCRLEPRIQEDRLIFCGFGLSGMSHTDEWTSDCCASSSPTRREDAFRVRVHSALQNRKPALAFCAFGTS